MRVTEHYVSGVGFTFVFRLVSITLYQHTVVYGNTLENKFTMHICFGFLISHPSKNSSHLILLLLHLFPFSPSTTEAFITL